MEYKPVGSARKFFKYSECKPGQVLIDGAKYLGPKTNNFDKAKEDFEFDVDGAVHVLNSAGKLNYAMGFVNPGDVCRIIYKGKSKVAKGPMAGKEAHDFDVQVAQGTPLATEAVEAPKKSNSLKDAVNDLSDLE